MTATISPSLANYFDACCGFVETCDSGSDESRHVYTVKELMSVLGQAWDWIERLEKSHRESIYADPNSYDEQADKDIYDIFTRLHSAAEQLEAIRQQRGEECPEFFAKYLEKMRVAKASDYEAEARADRDKAGQELRDLVGF
jgi:hypothetical protein